MPIFRDDIDVIFLIQIVFLKPTHEKVRTNMSSQQSLESVVKNLLDQFEATCFKQIEKKLLHLDLGLMFERLDSPHQDIAETAYKRIHELY